VTTKADVEWEVEIPYRKPQEIPQSEPIGEDEVPSAPALAE
jgi:hypothetical protein